MGLDGALRHLHYVGDLLDWAVIHIKQQHGSAFSFGEGFQASLHIHPGIAGGMGRHGVGDIVVAAFKAVGLVSSSQVHVKFVVRDSVEPCAEAGNATVGAQGKVSLYKCLLGKVVGQRCVAQSQVEQKPPQSVIILFHQLPECVAVVAGDTSGNQA